METPPKYKVEKIKNNIELNKSKNYKIVDLSTSQANKIKRHLNKINEKFLKNSESIRIIFVSSHENFVIALPKNIYMSTAFLENSEKYLNSGEIAATICHEASHILSDDWGNRISKENSSYAIDYKDTMYLKGYTTSKLGYKWAKKFNKGLTLDEYKEMVKSNFELHSSSPIEDNPYVITKQQNKGVSSLGRVTDSQGFKLETEYYADELTTSCLKSLGFPKNNILHLLEKLKTNFGNSIDKKRINQRISYIKRYIQ